ncbi:unnamed protein product [Prunus armeniaca]
MLSMPQCRLHPSKKRLTECLVESTLANVDPIDVARNIAGLNLETTLERKPGRSGHLLHKNCASGSLSCSCKRFSGEGRCSLIGPPVTALVCSNGNQGQLVFCKQHGAVVKERTFKSLLDWLKRVVFLPLITMLSQKHSISRYG